MSKTKMKIISEVRLITPTWAKEQLEELARRVAQGLFRQRPIRRNAIKRYAADMRAGKWVVTHQGIAFDTEGNLMDGQNRLHAVVEAGVSVKMMVTTGLPPEQEEAGGVRTMDGIDVGVTRNVWQALQISHGFRGEAIEMSSMARNLCRLVISNPNRTEARQMPQMSTAQALYVLEDLNYRASIERLIAIVPIKTLRPAAFSAPWCFYHQAQPKKAEAFATDYATLQNLGKGHPALQLYRFISTRNLRPRKRDSALMTLIANALMTYHIGETIGVLKDSDEAHLWLLKLNWPHVDKITEMLLHENAPAEPTKEERDAA